MKKIRQRIRAMRSTLSVKTYKMPRVFIIMTMISINIIVLIVAAIIALLIDDSYQSFVEAFAFGSVTWLLSPNSILAIDNPYTLFLAVIVLIIGIVLFSGTIIALITNALKDYFERKQTSSGKIYMDQHIVILNWNNKIPELVADLHNVKSLVEQRLSIIILSDVDRRYAEEKIRSAMLKANIKKDKTKQLNCLIKQGDPLNRSELEDISIERSRAVLVMNKETRLKEEASLTIGDLNIIKIILTLGQLDMSNETTIIAEVKQFASKAKVLSLHETVDSLKKYRLFPICFDRRLGQIMAQTIIQKYTEDVYLELFSFQGAQIHRLENVTFETCLLEHTHALPLKTDHDNIYVLCDAKAHTMKTSKTIQEIVPLKVKPYRDKVAQNVIIVGSNNKKRFIEESLREYEELHGSKFVVESVDESTIEALAKQLNTTQEEVSVLLLSDESQNDDALDANVINNLLYLKQALNNDNVHVLVELFDPKNDRLIKDFNIDNTIISNKIVSLLLGQVAMFSETENFYDDLLSIAPHDQGKDNAAITIKRLDTLLDENYPLEFPSSKSFAISLYKAFKGLFIPIGIIRDNKTLLFSGDLSKELLSLHETDEIILYKV